MVDENKSRVQALATLFDAGTEDAQGRTEDAYTRVIVPKAGGQGSWALLFWHDHAGISGSAQHAAEIHGEVGRGCLNCDHPIHSPGQLVVVKDSVEKRRINHQS